MDLLLDSDTNDIVFVNGQCPATQHLANITAQRLKINLQTFYGEWFLDTSIGIPYFQQVFGKVRRKSVIDVMFQGIIAEDPDVLEILSFTSTLGGDRTYSMEFSVRVTDNTESLPITVSVGV